MADSTFPSHFHRSEKQAKLCVSVQPQSKSVMAQAAAWSNDTDRLMICGMSPLKERERECHTAH